MIRKRKRIEERRRSGRSPRARKRARCSLCVHTEDEAVGPAESTDYNVLFVNNSILGLVVDGKPFLTVRGVMRYRPEKRFVTIDMGAVPFIVNGADCMGPGIVDADESIQEGDMVWIRDVKNLKALAIGISNRSGAELKAKKPGKAIRSLQYVGDKLWKTEE